MVQDNCIPIEVAYAIPNLAPVVLRVPKETTVEAAIQLSGLYERFSEIEGHVKAGRVGIFGKLVRGGDIVKPDERIEIYRPLSADPKALRKDRLKGKG